MATWMHSNPAHVAHAASREEVAERTAVAFGISATVTVLFNTVLAWVKDAYEPLNTFMAHLTGHHWWTHGIFNLVLFAALGLVLANRGAEAHLTDRLVIGLAVASVAAGAGLALWFLVV